VVTEKKRSLSGSLSILESDENSKIATGGRRGREMRAPGGGIKPAVIEGRSTVAAGNKAASSVKDIPDYTP